MKKSIIENNYGQRGGAIKLESSANFTGVSVTFSDNYASQIGGVFYVTTQAFFTI